MKKNSKTAAQTVVANTNTQAPTITIHTKDQLKKMGVERLTAIAEEVGVKDTFTEKHTLISAILNNQVGAKLSEETTITPAAEAPAAIVAAEAPKIGEKVNIDVCGKGDIIHYLSSKKLYMIAEKTEGEKPSMLLVSKTQTYKATKLGFEVMRVFKADAVSNYSDVVKTHFKSDKNTSDLSEFIKQAEGAVAELAKKAVKVETPAAEPVAPVVVAEPVAEVVPTTKKAKAKA